MRERLRWVQDEAGRRSRVQVRLLSRVLWDFSSFVVLSVPWKEGTNDQLLHFHTGSPTATLAWGVSRQPCSENYQRPSQSHCLGSLWVLCFLQGCANHRQASSAHLCSSSKAARIKSKRTGRTLRSWLPPGAGQSRAGQWPSLCSGDGPWLAPPLDRQGSHPLRQVAPPLPGTGPPMP